MPPRSHYRDVQEWSWDLVDIYNKVIGFRTKSLRDPTNSHQMNGLGICRFRGTCDCLNHRRQLVELTSDNDSIYFDQLFLDEHSTQQLIDMGFERIEQILDYMRDHGVASEAQYKALAANLNPTHRVKDPRGCVKLSIASWRLIPKPFNPVNVDAEELKWITEIEREVTRYGPVVAYFSCRTDVRFLAQDFIYESEAGFIFNKHRHTRSHAVMVIGAGRATVIATGKVINYLVIYNNWGNFGNPIGRIPLRDVAAVYVPEFSNQENIPEFRNRGGNNLYEFVENVFV